MPDSHPSDLPDSEEVERLVRRWLAASADAPVERGSDELGRLLRDPRGLEFTLGFVDRVLRPEDPRVAAREFERLSRRVPHLLPWYLRSAVVAGGGFGVVAPRPIVPAARAVFRRLVRHLTVDAVDQRLAKALGGLRRPGVQLDVNLLTRAALGDRGAARNLETAMAMLARADVDQMSISISGLLGPQPPWAFEESVDRVVEQLTPLYAQAARSRARKLITLDFEGHRDFDLTLTVFTRLLTQPDLMRLEAGIVLPAYLPDALPALERLAAWARERVAADGAGIKVRLVKGSGLAQERAEAVLHGHPLATWGTRAETEAQYLRMLSVALDPTNTDAVRLGVAGHNLFDLAFAQLLAQSRGVASRVDFEMLLGMAPSLAEAVRADTGGVLLSVPVVDPAEFDAAIPYLARRLEELASADGFLAALPVLDDPEVFAREAGRFAAARELLPHPVPPTHRTQDRSRADVPRAPESFTNTPDTDPAVAGNRAWARGVLSRAATSTLGTDTAVAARLTDVDAVAERVRQAAAAGADWGRLPGSDRAEHLDRAGEVLAAFRGRLIEVMVAETGTTFVDADAEVSAAVDSAYYYAARARELAGIPGAVFAPVALTVVAPSWSPPVSVAAGGVLAALAAGSAVLLRPAAQAVRVGAVLAEALWEAGIPRDVLGLVVADGDAERELVGAAEVGLLLQSSPRVANAMVITPSADLDLAVTDLVRSAFRDAGQHPAAVSLAILVGSVGTSERFRQQLADAVSSLTVGPPLDAETQVGPLIAPAAGDVARALTKLAEGESWLVKPRQLDDTDRLWSPGVRDGVLPGSDFHRVNAAAPVLGLMTVPDLRAAIAVQNALESGRGAGIHALDARDVAVWLDRVRASELVVNRPLGDAVVRRRPSVSWSLSAGEPGAAAGGPNTLLVLGDWQPEHAEPAEDLTLDALDARVRTVIEAFQPVLDFPAFDRVRRAALADEEAWVTEFARGHDPSALGIERNVMRYRPAEVVVRWDDGATPADLARVLCAGVRARAKLLVSTATPLPAGLLPFIDDDTPLGGSPLGILGVKVESDLAFRVRAAKGLPARIRLVGSDAVSLTTALDDAPGTTVWASPVTAAGRLELLPFLREQSVSITAHRFGTPDKEFQALVV
ncbi:proline dehydrogenase family protein [Pseudolysinimonas sp.]|jgi:RHH-type proline utilization regulon transcriptional repressor/proline dehydrogenase/delta 1-pyrroline-5-carboxylate dehydrogenase|uniref:proline dehydrogenase family protein n=1 Tax=Pseudolysinimonas sp. TaxID=2680009 RepID=UPI00378317AA